MKWLTGNAPGLTVALASVGLGAFGVWSVSSALEQQPLAINAKIDSKFDVVSAQLNTMGYDLSGRVSALEVRVEMFDNPASQVTPQPSETQR